MSPERIAELRRRLDPQYDIETRGPFAAKFRDAKPEWREMLDEIERLRALLIGMHRLDYYERAGAAMCFCGWVRGHYPGASVRGADEAERLHAAHVAAILNDGAS